ncbi:hypothetical protein CCR75_007086 [Bremia lactucae]|uniref:Uncharacterized protein n=1 Tax=Bremia lactucae TaxID=4779 RepID=A0A976FFZ3_BRELC|nr:hypothetical protein CCR75_007086 [Bremia lactucae]
MATKAAFTEDRTKVLGLARSDNLRQPSSIVVARGAATTTYLAPDVQKEGESSLKCPVRQYVSLSVQHKSRSEKEAIRKRIYHQRIKAERNTLRQMVKTLTLKLEHVQRSLQANAHGKAWEIVAMEERDKLLRAQAEQRLLVAAAETKASCILELTEKVSNASSRDSMDSQDSLFPSIPPFDFMMFRGHLRRVHEMYAQTDQVLDFKGMADGVVTSCKRRDEDNEVDYFEWRQKLTEPFSYAHTQQTMWQLGKLFHRQHFRDDFGEVAGSNDISVIRYRVVQTLASNATVSVLKRYVVRRFSEDHRTVFVWKTHSEGEGIFQGMHADETGWICIEPTVDENVTLVRVCVRQVPVRFGISTFQVEDFHEILQSSVHEDMNEITSALDKLLLQDTLADIEI